METDIETGTAAAPGRWKLLRLLTIAGLVVAVDQLTKSVVMDRMALYESIAVIPGLFDLTYIHNPGGAFGFLAGGSPVLRRWVFIGASALATVLVLVLYLRVPARARWLSVALALIFGGAVGNLVDRLRFGLVIDFLDVYVGTWHWPAFNAADSAITVGITIFVVHMVLGKLPE